MPQIKRKNLVVGAGFSGAVIAERLANILKEDVLVIDKNPYTGGVCHDYKDKTGITIQEFGSHIFHTNFEYIWKYINKFTKFNTYMHKVSASIDGKETPIPVNFNTIYDIFSPSFAKKLEDKLIKKYGYNNKISILEFKTKPFLWDKDLDFLASYIYEKLFIHLEKKQWNMQPYDISPALAYKVFIKTNKDDRYFEDKYQGIPLNGYSKLIENLLHNENIKILTGVDFKSIDTNGFDRIFYKGPIDEFFEYKYGVLGYRSAHFEFLECDTEYYQKSAVANYPNDYDFIRIHEFKHYLNEKSCKKINAKEYVSDFILGNNSVQNKRCYPVLNTKNKKMYKLYKDEAKKVKNIYFLGRLGDFKNYTIDESIKRALEVFNSIKYENAEPLVSALYEDPKEAVKD